MSKTNIEHKHWMIHANKNLHSIEMNKKSTVCIQLTLFFALTQTGSIISNPLQQSLSFTGLIHQLADVITSDRTTATGFLGKEKKISKGTNICCLLSYMASVYFKHLNFHWWMLKLPSSRHYRMILLSILVLLLETSGWSYHPDQWFCIRTSRHFETCNALFLFLLHPG